MYLLFFRKVDYYNCFGCFVDNHTIEATDKNGKKVSKIIYDMYIM